MWVRARMWLSGGAKYPLAAPRRRDGAGAAWAALVAAGVLMSACIASDGQGRKPATAPAPVLRTPQQIISDLTAAIDWYDHLTAFTRTPVSVDESLYRDSVRASAGQSVRLAFDLARAEAQLLADAEPAPPTTAPGSKAQTVTAMAASATQRIADINAQLTEIDRQLTFGATTRPSEILVAERAKLLAQLNLVTERRDVLLNFASFLGAPQNSVTELLQKIDDLERNVPDLPPETPITPPSNPTAAAPGDNSSQASADKTAGSTTNPASPPAPQDSSASAGSSSNASPNVLAPVGLGLPSDDPPTPQPAADAGPAPFRPETAGIFGLVGEVFNLTGRMSSLNDLKKEAEQLQTWTDEQRDPLIAQVKAAVRLGDVLSADGDSTSVTRLNDETQKLQALGERYRLLTSALLPLSEESDDIKASSGHIEAWHQALSDTYNATLRYLLLRLGAMLGGILIVIVVSRLWKRATFRYVTDPRRRRVFLLVQRMVSASLILIIILLTFETEFGSVATFTGFLTAGIAVALQSIILAGVAYFFVIGRYGIRIGDRVTVNGVTGDVVDTGLFRFYLMELGGTGTELHPTGRIVVFSNAVLFQAAAFYKQMPGAEYTWHEVSMTLAPDSDYKLAQDMLLAAVQSVYVTYKDRIREQHRSAASQVHVPMSDPEPQGRLRFVDAGLEYTVRYPVEISRAAEVDDEVTRVLLSKIQSESRLKLVVSGTPKIQKAA